MFSSNGEEVSWLHGNEKINILVSVTGATIRYVILLINPSTFRVHSLNDGSTLNSITLSSTCKHIFGIQLSKHGYFVVWGSTTFQDPEKKYFIQAVAVNTNQNK